MIIPSRAETKTLGSFSRSHPGSVGHQDSRPPPTPPSRTAVHIHTQEARLQSLHQQDVLLKLGGEQEATHFLAHLGTNFPQSIKLLKPLHPHLGKHRKLPREA